MKKNRKPSGPNRKCIIVLGMHRSGTSAMTGVLHYLGVDLGNDLLAPKPDNPKGFWEHREIYEIHEQLLHDLGSVWDDIRPLPENWWLERASKRSQDQILAVLRRDFMQSKLWGLKEPRLCRLMPLWHPVFPQLRRTPHFIIVFRNPEEVAASLNARNGLMRNKALMFWLDHVLESERETRNYPRVFVSMEQLLRNWKLTMERIGRLLNIKWPVGFQSAEENVEGFLEHDLKHHHVSDDDLFKDAGILQHVLNAYRELKNASSHEKGLKTELYTNMSMHLQEERQRFMTTALAEDIGERLASISVIAELLAQKDQELVGKEAQLEEKEAQLTKMLNSRSWKMTSPLRKGSYLIRHLMPNKLEVKGH